MEKPQPLADASEALQGAGAVLTCTAANAAAFNARLRTEIPGAFDLAKALHQAGLIDGLAGARIAPLGALEERGVVPQLSDAAESRLSARHVPPWSPQQ